MSTAARVIRPAQPEDMQALLSLRQEYCKEIYRGFDVLCDLKDDEQWVASFKAWMEDPAMQIRLLYLDNILKAFSACRIDAASAHSEIVELQCLPDTPPEESLKLVESILKELNALGVSQVTVWVLRDNLRSRFHYQQLGFKPDGNSRETQVSGETLSWTRYIYFLKEPQ
jgi:hypothetical protein